MFKKHHYLDGNLSHASENYIGVYENKIICFMGVIQSPMKKGAKRVHRLVVLPEYQGIGVGTKFMNEIAKLYTTKNWEFFITTSNKGLVKSLKRNTNYKLVGKSLNKPFVSKKNEKLIWNDERIQIEYEKAFKRYLYSFKYMMCD